MPGLEEQLHRFLESAADEPPRGLELADVRRVAQRQRLRAATIGALAVAVVAAAVGIPLAASRGHGQPTRLTTKPSPAPSGNGSDDAAARAAGIVVGLDRENRLVRAWPGTERDPRPISARAIPGGPSLIATDPVTAGWVVSFTPDQHARSGNAAQRLAWVSTDGAVEPFGPTFAAGDAITGLAVNPTDGTVAVAIFHTSDARPAEVQLIAGSSGRVRTWTADNADVNEIISLSWNEDGTELAYIAGAQTGAGIGGDPSFLHVNRPGRTAPTDSPWRQQDRCSTVAASWLQRDRFAVIAECGGNTDSYRLVDPRTGGPIGASQALGEAGCLGTSIHPSDSNNDVLIGACNSLYLVHNQGITKLHDALQDAAWPGHHPPSQ